MTFYEEWKKRTDESVDPTARDAFIKRYYNEEREAYDFILSTFPDRIEGDAAAVSSRLGFTEPAVFAGFLEGLNPSLSVAVDLETLDDATMLSFDIDFGSLYWNMLEAKADWLHRLKSWDGVLDETKREEIVKRFRTSKMATSSKTGRNDPCPCGSNRKYKVCCGKN